MKIEKLPITYCCILCGGKISRWSAIYGQCKCNSCEVKSRGPMKQEIKDKIAQSNKGKVRTPEQKERYRQSKLGEKGPMFGKTHSNEYIERLRHDMIGEKNPWYKDGRTPLHVALRNLKTFSNWKIKVFQRDDFTCQDCGVRGGKLEAHHIKYFSEILNEFLEFYNQFSPKEDKETLLRLSYNWSDFWDVRNGKTLCSGCHDKYPTYIGKINNKKHN